MWGSKEDEANGPLADRMVNIVVGLSNSKDQSLGYKLTRLRDCKREDLPA